MENYSVYEDIANRTGGDIYIGVVGPVRTGKSTFIKRFMETLVIPSASENERAVMTDELPQSAAGKTVMTTEPKFVPAKAAKIAVAKGAEASVRLVDCVGFAVEGANGFEEEGMPRLVKTPWSETAMPFEQAAALGTEKVIKEHSTIGVLVTTDGSITDIARPQYVAAEERAVAELKASLSIDKVPSDKKLMKKVLFYTKIRMVYTRGYAFTKGSAFLRLLSKIMLLLPRKTQLKIRNKYEKKILRYKDLKDNFICMSLSCPEGLNIFYPQNMLDEYTTIKFGDREFSISTKWDGMLKANFGDYMKLPPEEDRICKHNAEILDFGEEE